MFAFNSSLFFWTLINFIVLLGVLHRFALPSFYKMVDEHEKKKNAALLDLEASRQEAQVLLNAYQKKMAQVEEEVASIIHKTKLENELFRKEETQKMLEEKKTLLDNIQSQISMEKKRILDDLKRNIADLVVSTAQKVLHRELKKEEHLSLIQENIEEFEKLKK